VSVPAVGRANGKGRLDKRDKRDERGVFRKVATRVEEQ